MSMRNKALAGLAAGLAFMTLTPLPALAGTVVAVSGPSAGTYPVGTQIGDTQRITLRDGDTLTVLDDGGTRVLRGPGTFMLARAGGQSRNRAFAALTTSRSSTRARTGAVRSAAAEVKNPSLWYVDVKTTGPVCLSSRDQIRFWRGDTQAEAVYSVVPAGHPDEAARITFPESEMLADWDAAVTLREGVPYTIGAAPQDEATQVSFVFIEDAPEDPEGLAQSLIANGCFAQLEQLSAAMREG